MTSRFACNITASTRSNYYDLFKCTVRVHQQVRALSKSSNVFKMNSQAFFMSYHNPNIRLISVFQTVSLRAYSNTPPKPSQDDSSNSIKTTTPRSKILEKTTTRIVAAKNAAKNAAKIVLQDTKRKIPQHENIYTIPNMLTFTRILSAPIIGYLVVHQQLYWAVSLFAYSCVTDFVDGWIARHYKLQTVVGSVIDPMADKILMITLASCLAASGDIPMYMAVIILGRDILLGFSALYYRYISLPPPKTFTRFWDFSIPSAEVHPTTISKYNTFFQMIYLGSSLISPVLMENITGSPYTAYVETTLKIMEYTVATTTILSGLSYVFSKNAVKILNKP